MTIVRVACALLWIASAVPAFAQESLTRVVGQRVPCHEGTAAGFACHRVDLLSFLPILDIGGATVLVGGNERPVTLNDVWGWTDPETGREYALVGRSDGTSFVDVTDPVNPRFLGILPSHEIIVREAQQTAPKVLHDDNKGVSSWRDVKVINDHLVVVADASPNHGIQIFDLTELRAVSDGPIRFDESAHYDGIGSAHNIAVNEETGYVYAVGSSGGTGDACGGGLHMVDFEDPLNPSFAGCFADPRTGLRGTGYTHDVQCVVYHGPDVAYHGREICVGSNETAISIADVTDKANPVALSIATYPDAQYIHQGWFTPDQRYFLQDDEMDEAELAQRDGSARTRTMIWDLEDLDAPRLAAVYEGETQAIDHNLYVHADLAYLANYKAGLRILDVRDVLRPEEIAYFDTYPPNNDRGYEGAWSNYPFFKSGIVVVTSIREGLFVLNPLPFAADVPGTKAGPVNVGTGYPNPFTDLVRFELRLEDNLDVTVAVYDILGRRVARLHEGRMQAGIHRLEWSAAGRPAGLYFVKVATAAGQVLRQVSLVR